MAEYYLISQLPSLDGVDENMPLPITEERFLELCDRFLSKKTLRELSRLSLIPTKNYEKSTSSLVDSWNDTERNLRFALARMRADKMNKTFETDNQSSPTDIVTVARTAVDIESPMEAEKFLNSYRLEFLESLRPMDAFSEDMIFYYWLKLKLISRIKQFDADAGTTAYKHIYNSILNGTDVEAL